MLNQTVLKMTCIFGGLLAIPALAQTDFGVNVPVTLSGGALYSQRLQLATPDAAPGAAAFRAMLYPTVRLGSHWFGYAALQVRSTPYFYYDAFNSHREVYTDALQAFVGYSLHTEKASAVFKAGKLSTAFGSFPLHYDDVENPLLDQPLSYITDLPLPTNQFPCSTNELLQQHYGGAYLACGGRPGYTTGPAPVTLYGLPGVEADLSAAKFDGRFQLTTGSPINPRPINEAGDYLQWAAGGGYTIHQGLRVGLSGFRGPYLDRSVSGFLPAGTTIRDYSFRGVGEDVQWARGRWSANAELHHFRFDSPNFTAGPTITSGYVDLKSVITPRFFAAVRGGFFYAGNAVDKTGVSTGQWAPYLRSYELGGGMWVARNQLLKGSYGWLRSRGASGTRFDVFGFEYVVQVHSLAWAFTR